MKEINSDNLDIRIDTKRGRLYFPVFDSRDAELHYMIHDNGDFHVIEFTHTYVPEPLRNIGVGTKLVQKGMELAKANDYEVDATCPFVEDYLSKHPEFGSMRVTYA